MGFSISLRTCNLSLFKIISVFNCPPCLSLFPQGIEKYIDLLIKNDIIIKK